MALNERPCKDCKFYDRIILGDDSTKTRMGRCAAKSIYPALEQPGQIFPPGVKRMPLNKRGNIVPVYGSDVVANCLDFRALS